MNKKGFTLIEVFAVIVILGLLFAIISPTVVNLLDDSEDALHDEQINMVITAAKKYMIEHSEYLPEVSDSSIVYIEDLINSGIIDNDTVIDPKSKEELNGCVVVNYNNDFNQYEYNYRDDCLITVTFDPEGGSVSTESKGVMKGKAYGELPTPTREGYIFKGWRGKNAFNPQKFYDIGKNYKVDMDGESIILSQYPYQENYTKMSLNLKKNTQYTLSYNWLVTQISQCDIIVSGLSLVYDDDGIAKSSVRGALGASGFKTLTSDLSKNLTIIQSAGWQWSGTMKLSNIQLEEGNTATEYEPYQEYSSDTIVTKDSDHVLHAIWEVAS